MSPSGAKQVCLLPIQKDLGSVTQDSSLVVQLTTHSGARCFHCIILWEVGLWWPMQKWEYSGYCNCCEENCPSSLTQEYWVFFQGPWSWSKLTSLSIATNLRSFTVLDTWHVHPLKWLKIKRWMIPPVGKDMKQLELSLLLGLYIGTPTLENCLTVSTKAEHHILWPS